MTATVRNVLIVLTIIFAALGVASDQIVTRGYIYSNIGSGFTWAGSAQSWSGSTVTLSCTDWNTYIKNDGTACPSSQTVVSSFALAHAVNSISHTPILANNTFVGGNFASWTATGSCSPFVAVNAPDQDNDLGYSRASSGVCTASAVTLSQTVSISGTPTSQTYSFWYNVPAVSSGDPDNCTEGIGAATLSLVVNGTTVASPTLTIDGKWHHVSGTMTALASGSNSVQFSGSVGAAVGKYSHYNKQTGEIVCNSYNSSVAETLSIDDVVLSAVY